jgi:hypothetical protein
VTGQELFAVTGLFHPDVRGPLDVRLDLIVVLDRLVVYARLAEVTFELLVVLALLVRHRSSSRNLIPSHLQTRLKAAIFPDAPAGEAGADQEKGPVAAGPSRS